MADTFSKPSNVQQKLKWARIWFSKLMNFHGFRILVFHANNGKETKIAYQAIPDFLGLTQRRERRQEGNLFFGQDVHDDQDLRG